MPLLAINPVGFDAVMFVEYGLDEIFAAADRVLRKALCIIGKIRTAYNEHDTIYLCTFRRSS